jgi:hypothetical protein
MAAFDGQDAVSPRVEDLRRHLDDVRLHSYEGAGPREERNQVFGRAVELLDPVVSQIMQEVNATFLDGTGTVTHHEPGDDGSGGLTASWELSWPEQRAAVDRQRPEGGPVGPVRVIAWFGARFTHGHLSGSDDIGHWPLQVLDEEDARRQATVVRVIIERELHECIYRGNWHVITSYAREHATSQTG